MTLNALKASNENLETNDMVMWDSIVSHDIWLDQTKSKETGQIDIRGESDSEAG